MAEQNEQEEKKTLATVVYEGWVKRDHGNFVTIELDTPEGARDIYIGIDDCVDRKLPEFGRAIRYRTTIESAPDLESDYDPQKEGVSTEGILRKRSEPGKPGVYRLGE